MLVHVDETVEDPRRKDGFEEIQNIELKSYASSVSKMELKIKNWTSMQTTDCCADSIRGSGKTFLPLNFGDERSLSFNVSKSMTRLLRHRGLHRAIDGAMDWKTLFTYVFVADESDVDRTFSACKGLTPLSFLTQCQLDCIEKEVSIQGDKVVVSKDSKRRDQLRR